MACVAGYGNVKDFRVLITLTYLKMLFKKKMYIYILMIYHIVEKITNTMKQSSMTLVHNFSVLWYNASFYET